MAMKMMGSAQRSIVVFLLTLLVLCFFGADAAALKATSRAHSHRAHSKSLRSKGVDKADEESDKNNKDDDSDDDDDDDDDDDTTTAAAGSKQATKKAANSHEAAEAKLQKAVAKAEQDLASNLAEQKELKDRVKHLSDSSSDREIDASAKLVANETDSAAMADMMGRMWKEMRMFEMPFYAQHVEEEVHHLKRKEKSLEEDVTAAQASLSAARKKWGVADKEEKKKTSEAIKTDDEDAAKKEKDDDDDAAKDKDGDAKKEKKDGKDDKDEVQVPVKKVSSQPAGGVVQAEDAVMHQWSFWHMPWVQQRSVLVTSFVYLLFGALLAFIYNKARAKYPSTFNPKPDPALIAGHPQKDFSFGLFSCFSDPAMCMIGCCCPTLRWADTMDRKGLLSYWKAFFLMFILLLLHTYTMGISTLAVCILGIVYRQKLRRKYGIEKGGKTIASDAVAWFCCQFCAIVQEAREQAAQPGP